MWGRSATGYRESTVRGIVEADGSIGAVTRSFDTSLSVPGGRVAAAGVTSVGVRADRRRRGYLRALMTDQLHGLAATGTVAAVLRATEGAIYSRFGFGVASRYATVTVDPSAVRWRSGPATGAELRMASATDAVRWLPEVYERVRNDRPGQMSRPTWWWTSGFEQRSDGDEPLWVLYTVDHDGAVSGWVLYTAAPVDSPTGAHRARVQVVDLVGADADAELALWRAVLGIDLADSVNAPRRPLDEALPLALTDERVAQISGVEDETWLRLIDVPAALRARRYGPGTPVVLDVADPVFPGNHGRYRIGPDGTAATDAPPDITLDVSELACVYLGGTRMSALGAVGRVQGSAAALRNADLLFATAQPPWCGTYF